MDKKAPIVKRLIDGDRAQIFHSSAYARAQNGGGMGAASAESFAQRQRTEQNRQNIRKYSDSLVAERRFNTDAIRTQRQTEKEVKAKQIRNVEAERKLETEKPRAGHGRKTDEPVADPYAAAEKRAEMSARFAGGTGREETGKAGKVSGAEVRRAGDAKHSESTARSGAVDRDAPKKQQAGFTSPLRYAEPSRLGMNRTPILKLRRVRTRSALRKRSR